MKVLRRAFFADGTSLVDFVNNSPQIRPFQIIHDIRDNSVTLYYYVESSEE